MGIVYPITLPRARQGMKTSWKLSQAIAYGESNFSKQGQTHEHGGGRWLASVSIDSQPWNPASGVGMADWVAALASLKGPKGTFWLGFPAATSPRGTALPDISQNLLLYSEEFDNAAWTKADLTTAANDTMDPQGATRADKLTADNTTAQHWTYQVRAGAVSAKDHFIAVSAKAGTDDRLIFGDGGDSTGHSIVVDLSSGSILTETNLASSSITSLGSGWYRIVMIYNRVSGGNVTPYFGFTNSDSATNAPSFLAAGTENLYLFGAQAGLAVSSAAYVTTTDSQAAPSNPRVNGGGQTGSELVTTGWLAGQDTLLKGGDFIQVGNYLYMLTQDAVSDSAGGAALDIVPSLRESPSDSQEVITENPQGLFRLLSPEVPLGDYDANLANAGRLSFQAVSI